MKIDNSTKSEETKDVTNGTSDFGQWSAFAWKLIRSLAIVAAGTTAIVFICRWLIY
jgi:hypothetical protein